MLSNGCVNRLLQISKMAWSHANENYPVPLGHCQLEVPKAPYPPHIVVRPNVVARNSNQ